MGMIKRADLERITREARVMDLDDLEKRGKAIIDNANAKAVEILSAAKKQRDRLISTASEEGHEQGSKTGYEAGFEEGRQAGIEQARQAHEEQLQQLLGMWADQLGAFEHQRDEMLEAARVECVELAGAIATRVVRRAIQLDPSIVISELESILSAITEPTRLVVSVHPDDAELINQELPALVDRFANCEHAQVVTDPSLPRGSCVGRTPSGGTLDASINTQLNRIIDALLPNGQERGEVLGLPIDEQQQDDAEDSREDAA